METLFHIARRADWDAAAQTGVYAVSTLGRTLAQQGYIHLSFAHQVQAVANAVYARVDDELALLAIDPAKLTARLMVEPVDGTNERFPHLYGELPVAAVASITPYRRGADGRFTMHRT